MSSNEPPQHLHLLSSFELGWNDLNLLYEIEPADETPETYLGKHFIVIAQGSFCASYRINGNWKHVSYAPGELALIPATQLFPRIQIDRQVPLIELFLDPATLARAAGIEAEEIELIPQWQLQDPLIQHMGLALKAELEIGSADSRLYADSMATVLCIQLLRRYSSKKPQISNFTDGLPKYKLKNAIAYIHENLDESLTLAQLSQIVQMSPHYFATLFKQSTGLSPHQYIIKCRIDLAKQLLARQNLTLVEICQQVGFQNQSHFTRVFHQYTATTPKAFRDKL